MVQPSKNLKQNNQELTFPLQLLQYNSLFPKSLKDIQNILDLPGLKISKPSDTHQVVSPWKMCYNSERCYCAIVTTLEKIYEKLHEPGALGLTNLHYFPHMYIPSSLNSSNCGQVEQMSSVRKLDLTIISSVVDATLHTPDDILQWVAKWILDLQGMIKWRITEIILMTEDITGFQTNSSCQGYIQPSSLYINHFLQVRAFLLHYWHSVSPLCREVQGHSSLLPLSL